MQLTRRQKSFGTIAGLCVVALLVDRFFLSPSGATAAGEATPTETATPPAGTMVAPEAPPRNSKHIIASELDRLATEEKLDPESVRDIFRAPAGWIPKDPDFIAPIEQGSAADAFLSIHRLNAVMANRQGGYAIIDGKRLRVGEMLDGFTLVEARTRSAILERDGIRIELSLP